MVQKTITRETKHTRVSPRVTTISPYPTRIVLSYLSLVDELKQVKQRLAELEDKVDNKKVIVLKSMTKKEAKDNIRKLFSSGRTLYYSDIVQELGIDLETVVDICNELEKEGDVGIDANISQ